jgi:hypothetical protein
MIAKRQMCIVGVALLMILTLNGLVVGSVSAAKPSPTNVFLTSITLDPEDANGQTTNAPGAWSTNTGDPLSQVGVRYRGNFLNQPIGTQTGLLGEISIQLQSGLNTFTLYGNGVFPGTLDFGAILFFDHQVVLRTDCTDPSGAPLVVPQIAVYNANGSTGAFSIQPPGTNIMSGSNGGTFFGCAPGPNPTTGKAQYIAPDGTTVTVKNFTINSVSSTADLISYYYIGADGIPDTVATLQLDVTPPQ